MTRIVLLSVGYDMTPIVRPLLKAAPELVIVPEQEGSADVAVCWNPRPGSLARLRGLKLVHSIAAGVDNILADPALPAVPLCRVVDPGHAQGMTEFVTWGVLHFHRQMDRVLRNHARRVSDVVRRRRSYRSPESSSTPSLNRRSTVFSSVSPVVSAPSLKRPWGCGPGVCSFAMPRAKFGPSSSSGVSRAWS